MPKIKNKLLVVQEIIFVRQKYYIEEIFKKIFKSKYTSTCY